MGDTNAPENGQPLRSDSPRTFGPYESARHINPPLHDDRATSGLSTTSPITPLVPFLLHEPVTHQTEESGGQTHGPTSGFTPEPKFFGFCCQPARSCCCGCTLQFGMKAIALVAIILGSLTLFGFVVSLGTGEPKASAVSIIKSGLVLALGITLWRSSEKLCPRTARWSLWILGTTYTVDAVFILIFFIAALAMRGAVSKEMFEAFRREVEEREHRPLTPTEADDGWHTINLIIYLFFAAMVTGIILKTAFVLLFAYFIWSFKVRLDRGEAHIVTYGANILPLAYYPQQQAPVPSCGPSAYNTHPPPAGPSYLVPTYRTPPPPALSTVPTNTSQ